MPLPAGVRLRFEDRPPPDDREIIDGALDAHNRAFVGDGRYANFGIFARDGDGTIRGGLIGNAYAGWIFVSLLWVHEEFRRAGIGREMMLETERRAAALGCHSIWLDTFSFQAPGFYAKLGYREFGRLDYPPGHQRIFLQKQLSET